MTCPIDWKRQILEHLLMTPLHSTLPILCRTSKKLQMRYSKSYCSANKLYVNFKVPLYMTMSFPQKANKLKINVHSVEKKQQHQIPRHLHGQQSKLGFPHSTHKQQNI